MGKIKLRSSIKTLVFALIGIMVLQILIPTTKVVQAATNTIIQGEFQREDLNKDGKVDMLDISLISNSFHKKEGQSGYNNYYDIDNNKIIDIYDNVLVSMKIGEPSFRVYIDKAQGKELIGVYKTIEPAKNLAYNQKNGYILNENDNEVWRGRYEWYLNNQLKNKYTTLDEAIVDAKPFKESIIKDASNGDEIVWEGKQTIVIDPGHGGSDPGAIGPSGLKEKDVVLDVGLRVRDKLINKGYNVVMTRETDVYVSLIDRAEISNNTNGDCFVSIHNNSFSSSSANGTESFGDPGVAKSWNLSRNLQRNMVKRFGLRDRGVKDGSGLAVIRRNELPASLIELAFLSNRHEESLLASSSFRELAAEAIVAGIIESI